MFNLDSKISFFTFPFSKYIPTNRELFIPPIQRIAKGFLVKISTTINIFIDCHH